MAMNGYSNGHFNGHNGHNGHSEEAEAIATITLKAMIDDLNKDLSLIRPIKLKSGASGDSYVAQLIESIEVFMRRAAEIIGEAEANIDKRVHAKNRDHARKYVNELRNALSDIERALRHLSPAAQTMVDDLFSSNKRVEATQASKKVLTEITKFLLICDQLDVYFIVEGVDLANSLLHDLRNAKTTEEIEEKYQLLFNVLQEITESSNTRVAELRSSNARESVMAAQELVNSCVPVVYSTTKAVLRHPEYAAHCDAAHSDMHKALAEMRAALHGKTPERGFGSSSYLDGYGQLAAELHHFQNRFMMDPSAYRANRDRPDLEEILERIVTGSAGIADEKSTRHERKHKIISECNQLRQALQELLKEYENNRGRAETSEDMDMAMVLVERRMKDLKRHLRRAIIDNVGDAFLDRKTPLLMLIECASQGLRPQTEEAAYGPRGFEEHAKRLVEVAKLATEMSMDREGIKYVKFASEQVTRLIPQVTQAALLLCENPSSQMAIDHMEVMRKMWESKVHALTLGVGFLVSLDDFLAVTESHLVEDSLVAITAIAEGHVAEVDSGCGAIRGRCLRVYDMVDEALCEIGDSTGETVKVANRILRDEVRRFEEQSSSLLNRLDDAGENMTQQERSVEAQEFSNSCSLVLNAVKNIRNALLVNRNPDDVDSDNEYEDDGVTHADQKSTISDADNQQKVMRKLPEEDKKKIQEQFDKFNLHQKKFEQEVAMWDDNDIIILAKRMCAILGDMMDFTRGRGKLKSTMDVIHAAQEISNAGMKLRVLARQIGDAAEESNKENQQLKRTKADLVSYLAKMDTFCGQLNICSKVKADVTHADDGQVVVSGLDSVLTLTQAARNLLTAVVSAVQKSYILSTKFPTNSRVPAVSWEMTAPRKQPLVETISPAKNGREGTNRVMRRASERRAMPNHALDMFTRSTPRL